MTETLNIERLTAELRSLVEEAEALLRSGLDAGGAELQERAQDTLRELKDRLASLEQQLNARARDLDSYVREHPWQAVAIAGGAALLLGLIVARR